MSLTHPAFCLCRDYSLGRLCIVAATQQPHWIVHMGIADWCQQRTAAWVYSAWWCQTSSTSAACACTRGRGTWAEPALRPSKSSRSWRNQSTHNVSSQICDSIRVWLAVNRIDNAICQYVNTEIIYVNLVWFRSLQVCTDLKYAINVVFYSCLLLVCWSSFAHWFWNTETMPTLSILQMMTGVICVIGGGTCSSVYDFGSWRPKQKTPHLAAVDASPVKLQYNNTTYLYNYHSYQYL